MLSVIMCNGIFPRVAAPLMAEEYHMLGVIMLTFVLSLGDEAHQVSLCFVSFC